MEKFITKKVSTLIGIVMILSVAVIAFAGILVLEKTQIPEVVETKNTVSQNNETANWKTYKNDEYGFEFKYPENLFSKISQHPISEKTECNTSSPLSFIWIFEGVGKFNQFEGLDVRIFCKKTSFLFGDNGYMKARYGSSILPGDKKISNKQVYENIDYIPTTNAGTASYYIELDANNTLAINFPFDDRYVDMNLVDEILSTFKFIK